MKKNYMPENLKKNIKETRRAVRARQAAESGMYYPARTLRLCAEVAIGHAAQALLLGDTEDIASAKKELFAVRRLARRMGKEQNLPVWLHV